jgi:hypothetical protein
MEKSIIPMICPKRRERRELRIPVAVVVMLTGQNGISTPEWASTVNISARGARILTTHSRNPNERLLVKCAEGNLQARGKVVYRQRLHDNLYAIGIRLLAPRGKWEETSEVAPRGVLAGAS